VRSLLQGSVGKVEEHPSDNAPSGVLVWGMGGLVGKPVASDPGSIGDPVVHCLW